MGTSKNLVLAFGWSVDDGWYGKNYRAILEVEPGKGFDKAEDIKPYKKAFVALITKNHGRNIKGKVTASRFEIKQKSSYPTYIYCSMGPSYSCSNLEYKISDLNL